MMGVGAAFKENSSKIESVKERSMNLESCDVVEIKRDKIEDISEKKILIPDVEMVKSTSLEAIVEKNREKAEQINRGVLGGEGVGSRILTEAEHQHLKEKVGMTEANIEKCTIDESGLVKLKCINEEYAGMEHPETGVRYAEKVVDIDGVRIQVVVPEFESTVDVMLPDELKRATESEQFKFLNKWLQEEIKVSPELRAQFSEMQITMIEKGLRPRGFTWHHNEVCCKMQLVKFDEHSATRHTGGNSIWSGGN